MRPLLYSSLQLIFFCLFLASSLQASSLFPDREVYINGEKLSEETITMLEQSYRIKILDGRYWYDAMSGLWGYEGGPTRGVGVAGLTLGGSLDPNASRGNTQVFINGRHLPQEDLRYLTNLLGPIPPGQYWMDAQGNAGPVGGAATVNVWQVAQQSQAAKSGSWTYRNFYTGIGGGSDGETTYFIGKDFYYIK